MSNDNTQIVEIQEKDVQLGIDKLSLGTITTNIRQVKAFVEDMLPKYDISNYSTDDITKCKADKALLNKAAKALNDKRIELEKEWSKPFDEFKATCNETVKLIKSAISKIDTVIQEDETRVKAEKRNAIIDVAHNCGFDELGIDLSMIFNEKWLNKSTSLKSVESEIKGRIAEIKTALEVLSHFDDYYALVARYKENLDLQSTVEYANRLKLEREKSATVQQTAADETNLCENNDELANDVQEQSHGHIEDDGLADVIDAFANAMGQSAAPLENVIVKDLRIEGTAVMFQALEMFLEDTRFKFSVIS